MSARYPSLYQINTRVWLTDLSRSLGRRAILDDIPDAALDRLAGQGFDWIWLLSVWQTGTASQHISRTHREWRTEFAHTLPDLRIEDIQGSGFAITGYKVHRALGGDAALARLRERLRARGLKLMLDFVPNHVALDHPWVEDHPEFFVSGTEQDLAREPDNYARIRDANGVRILAYGRDPFFDGWSDTLQLDYSQPRAQDAMRDALVSIAEKCDGVRCDMAMLILPEVFERTWGRRAEPFWPAAIAGVRAQSPEFVFMAEVYWDLEWTLQQQGFDYTYDKRLYDRLREGAVRPIREHLMADLGFQDKLARFLENHDEPRAAATFAPGAHEAAAIVTFLTPGLRFFHQGQFEGRRVRISAHLVRAPYEATNPSIAAFYDQLLSVLRRPAVRDGHWHLLDCAPAWDGNGTWEEMLTWSWLGPMGERLLVAVNDTSHQSQCYVRLPFPEIGSRRVTLRDLLSAASYERDGNELVDRGLYLDLPPWGRHVFEITFGA
jgi:glycosidase